MVHLSGPVVRSHHLHGVRFDSYASSATGAARLAGWRTSFPPSTPGQAHTMSEEEVLYVLSGRLDIEIGDERFTAEAGDAALVRAGALFRVSNLGEVEASAWVTSVIGMSVTMHAGGQAIAPPWAQ